MYILIIILRSQSNLWHCDKIRVANNLLDGSLTNDAIENIMACTNQKC